MEYNEQPQEPCTIWQIMQPCYADKLSKQEPVYALCSLQVNSALQSLVFEQATHRALLGVAVTQSLSA